MVFRKEMNYVFCSITVLCNLSIYLGIGNYGYFQKLIKNFFVKNRKRLILDTLLCTHIIYIDINTSIIMNYCLSNTPGNKATASLNN